MTKEAHKGSSACLIHCDIFRLLAGCHWGYRWDHSRRLGCPGHNCRYDLLRLLHGAWNRPICLSNLNLRLCPSIATCTPPLPTHMQRSSAPVSDEYAWAAKYSYAINAAAAANRNGGGTSAAPTYSSMQHYAGQMRGTPYVQGPTGSPLGGYLGGTAGPAPS
jgi:hypothetical protein